MKSYTINGLEILVRKLNELTSSPLTMFGRDRNGNVNTRLMNVGHYYLSQANGGVCVERIANDQGGANDVIWTGHIPKRDAFNRLSAFLIGLEVGQQMTKDT